MPYAPCVPYVHCGLCVLCAPCGNPPNNSIPYWRSIRSCNASPSPSCSCRHGEDVLLFFGYPLRNTLELVNGVFYVAVVELQELTPKQCPGLILSADTHGASLGENGVNDNGDKLIDHLHVVWS